MTTPIINIETLQVYKSLSDCARDMKTTAATIHRAIKYGRSVKRFKLAYLSEWLQWEPKLKENNCMWGNVEFYTFSVDFCDNFNKKPYDYVKKSHLGEEKAGARSAHHMI